MVAVIPTSMGIRICPEDAQPVQTANRFTMQVTSAESSVGSIASYLGQPVKILTNFVQGSPISLMIKSGGPRFMDFEVLICRRAGGATATSSTCRPGYGIVARGSGATAPVRSGCSWTPGLRPRAHLRRRGREDRPYVGPDRALSPKTTVLPDTLTPPEAWRRSQLRPQLPRFLLEGT